ncbi:MAG: EI24 domain-containing protein [Rhodobacteraceae bacterium]|nr:EI24 domain-containing protein [Paracoccaceae bacterium]
MILDDFLKAVRQMPDRRFQGVLWAGIGLSVTLLAMLTAAVLWLLPDSISLPWYGEIEWLSYLLDRFAIAVMLVVSAILMVPVASLFMGFFNERVAAAVEDRHYPDAGPAKGATFRDTLADSIRFFGLILVVNMFGIIIYLFSAIAAPLVFWVVNGILLGREFFQLVAMRRIGRTAAQHLYTRHRFEIWVSGALMAVPLTIPIVNLCAPVLGAATFTHLYHRLAKDMSHC